MSKTKETAELKKSDEIRDKKSSATKTILLSPDNHAKLSQIVENDPDDTLKIGGLANKFIRMGMEQALKTGLRLTV